MRTEDLQYVGKLLQLDAVDERIIARLGELHARDQQIIEWLAHYAKRGS